MYNPVKCWIFLRDRHAKITEVKISFVTEALYACTIHRSETLSGYLDKFENLIREFYLSRGQMSDQQSARMLISSIPTFSNTTTELIHTQVVPLTRQCVSDYLREYKTRQGWSSPAMREANAAYGSTSCPSRQSGGKSRCTKKVCLGPHPEKDCWSKPENAKKKDDYLPRRNGDRSSQPSGSAATAIRGRKKLTPPNANAASLSSDMSVLLLHASYKNVSTPEADQDMSASAVSNSHGNGVWALHDTGAHTQCSTKSDCLTRRN